MPYLSTQTIPAPTPYWARLPRTPAQAQAMLPWYHARARQLSREKRAAEKAWLAAEADLSIVQSTADGEYQQEVA